VDNLRSWSWFLAAVAWFLGPEGTREWSTREGHRHTGQLTEYRWMDRTLLVRAGEPAGEGAAGAVLELPAQDLDLRSKVQLLLSEPFQDRFLAHREELETLEVYQDRLGQLRRLGAIFASVLVSGFVSVSWFLAGTILGNSSLGKWFLAMLAFCGLTFLGAWGFAEGIARFGAEQWRELLVTLLVAHTVLLVFAVWGIYRKGFLAAFWWCLWNWATVIVLPVTLTVTGLAAQVYGHYRALNLSVLDQYLTEVWLMPMGLI